MGIRRRDARGDGAGAARPHREPAGPGPGPGGGRSDVTTQFEQVPVEQVRDYWNRRPCNIRHSPKPVGTREYFDEVEARKYFVEPHIPGFAEFSRWAGKEVLEIGCG